MATSDFELNKSGKLDSFDKVEAYCNKLFHNVKNIQTAISGNDAAISGIDTETKANVLQNIMLNALNNSIEGTLVKDNLVDGMVDAFSDESGVDTVSSINEFYNSTDDTYEGVAESALLSYTGQTGYNTVGDEANDEYRVAQSFTLTEDTIISSIEFYMFKDNTPTGNLTFRVETNSGGKPSGTLANANAEKTGITPPSTGDFEWIKGTFDTSFTLSAGIYHAVIECDNQSANNNWRVGADATEPYTGGTLSSSFNGVWSNQSRDATFKLNVLSVANLTLISELTVAEEAPDTVSILILEEDVDAVTLNTDLKVYVSRDNGTTWTEGTLSDIGSTNDYQVLYANIDISAQPEDTDMLWKLVTANNKELKIHGVSMLWE